MKDSLITPYLEKNPGSSSNSSGKQNKLQKGRAKTNTNKSLKQTHLGARANSKQEPTLAITEIHDKEHGKKAYNQHHPSAPGNSSKTDDKKFKSEYRVNQVKSHPNWGGAGQDETVRTANVAKIPEKLKKNGYSDQEIEKTVGSLSEARDPVDQLVWAGDSKQPISGHPGALSKLQDNNSRGLAKRHPPKDRTRANWTDNQFDKGLNKPTPDLKKTTQDTVLMGQVMTNKHLSQPHKQLNAIDVSKSETDVYHPRHGKLVENQQKTPQFNKAIAAAHNAREARKLQTGCDLKKSGYGNLVPDETHAALQGHDSWESAHNARYKEQSEQPTHKIDTAPAESQALHGIDETQPKTLEELSNLNEDEKRNNPKAPKLVRAVSAPRPLIRPEYKKPDSSAPKLKQSNLDKWINQGKRI